MVARDADPHASDNPSSLVSSFPSSTPAVWRRPSRRRALSGPSPPDRASLSGSSSVPRHATSRPEAARGRHRSHPRLETRSHRDAQVTQLLPRPARTPPPAPRGYAAPSAVASVFCGRTSGVRKMSLWNCMRKPFADAPPSTFSSRSGTPASASIATARSCTWYASASSAARTTCARDVPRVRPVVSPRAPPRPSAARPGP